MIKKTVIGILCEAVDQWKKSTLASRETTAQNIVEAHQAIGADAVTGITFSDHQDTFTRHRVNATRIFRWLDEMTKDGGLMPLNFLQSTLAALPMDLRVSCVNEILDPVDMVARPRFVLTGLATRFSKDVLAEMMQEGTDAWVAYTALLDGATRPELQTAQKEIAEAIEKLQAAQAAVESQMSNWGDHEHTN